MEALFEVETLINGDLHDITQQARLLSVALKGQNPESPEEAGLMAEVAETISLRLSTLGEKLRSKHNEVWNSTKAANCKRAIR